MYRIGICDDDQLFCAQLEEMILSLELPQKVETEMWFSGEGIMRNLAQGTAPDILFLDIELYEKSGIDVGNYIRGKENYTTHIVYVSSKQEYAMQLFRIQPIDFLIKPVECARVREVLLRSMSQKRCDRAEFTYQKNGIFYKLPCDEILYLMSSDKKILIVTERRTEEFYGKLKVIAGQLPACFFPIHQSYIVNRDRVSEYTYESVKMCNGDVLSISKPYRRDVRSRLVQYGKERLHGKF